MADNTIQNGTDTLATDDIASGVAAGVKVQRMKNGFGVDGTYNDVAPDAGLPVTGQFVALTGSASANNTDLVSADVSPYRFVSYQATGTFTATITFQGSNDNVSWTNLNYYNLGGIAFQATVSTSSGASAQGYGPVLFRYFRARVTSYTSGTATIILCLWAHPPFSDTVQVRSVGGTYTTAPTSLTIPASDGSVNLSGVEVAPRVFNGTNWDRQRGATAGANTTGTGLPGAGILGFDGTNYQRAKVDTAGNQYVRPFGTATSAVTSVTAATSTTSLLAANAARVQALFFNDSTANLYLKLGATASTTSFTVKIPAAGYYELPTNSGVYTGAIDGIWDAVNGAVRVTEVG